MVAVSTGGTGASTSPGLFCAGSFISMSMVNHLNAEALKENDSGITHFNPAKRSMIMITIPTMINMAVPTPFSSWFPELGSRRTTPPDPLRS
jgi:hypothetical protein